MEKDPKRVAAGKKAATTRYGPPVHLNLNDLTPAQRTLVLGLIEAQREANRLRAADHPNKRTRPGNGGGDKGNPASSGEREP